MISAAPGSYNDLSHSSGLPVSLKSRKYHCKYIITGYLLGGEDGKNKYILLWLGRCIPAVQCRSSR